MILQVLSKNTENTMNRKVNYTLTILLWISDRVKLENPESKSTAKLT